MAIDGIDLSGQVALVTGSTQGLGEGIARRLARAGARVIVNGRSVAKGERVLADLQSLGAEAQFIAADLCDKAQAQHLVAATVEHFGRIDILVNNAQIVTPLIHSSTDLDADLQVTLASGLYASLWTSQAAFPFMRDQGAGRIVNFASINGVFGSKYGLAYNATKEAVQGLTRTLANEWGPHGITVNVVLPAGLSPAYEAFYKGDPKKADAVAKLNPLRRHGRAEEDIGAAILGLVSSEARYITGQSLFVDGGNHLLGLPQLHAVGPTLQS